MIFVVITKRIIDRYLKIASIGTSWSHVVGIIMAEYSILVILQIIKSEITSVISTSVVVQILNYYLQNVII